MIRFTYLITRKHTLGFVCRPLRKKITILHPSPPPPPPPPVSHFLTLSARVLLATSHTPLITFSPLSEQLLLPIFQRSRWINIHALACFSGSKARAIASLMGASLGCDGEKWGERTEGGVGFWRCTTSSVENWLKWFGLLLEGKAWRCSFCPVGCSGLTKYLCFFWLTDLLNRFFN